MVTVVQNEVWKIGAAQWVPEAAEQKHPPLCGKHIGTIRIVEVGGKTVKGIVGKVYGTRDYAAVVEIDGLGNRYGPVPGVAVRGAGLGKSCYGEKQHSR